MTQEQMVAENRRDRHQRRQSLGAQHRARHAWGPFMGMPPTGKPFTVTVMDVCRFENGKMVEHWGVADQLALMEQIGALPEPPQGKP
jgi:predicted ester cyclase